MYIDHNRLHVKGYPRSLVVLSTEDGDFSYSLNCHSPFIQRGHEIPPNQLDTIHMYCVHVVIQYEGPSPATTPSIVISFFKWNMKAHPPCHMYNSIVTVTALFYRKI